MSSQLGNDDSRREVVTLGEVCEITAGDEPDHGRTLSFSVAEFADLADGTRIVLRSERGFSSSINRGTHGYTRQPIRFEAACSRQSCLTTTETRKGIRGVGSRNSSGGTASPSGPNR